MPAHGVPDATAELEVLLVEDAVEEAVLVIEDGLAVEDTVFAVVDVDLTLEVVVGLAVVAVKLVVRMGGSEVVVDSKL